jgi:lipopolysaccharide transport system ATP-binding protein
MSDIAISVENLSKQYRIGAKQERQDTLRDWLVSRFRRRSHNAQDELIWALKDVSFEVKKGEVLGIIGRNGAGKSTLLKILSRITEPTKGRAVINGRVGSLLEVGTGFHRELTGRENIFLSGTILGMKRSEIDQRFDEIVEFSGVEKFIDTPIKRYSSGMMVRLGFAVAAYLEPEILLVDEVLAVGDAEFQRKCLGKIEAVANEGRTILFVSHNMVAMQNIAERVVWLDSGIIEDNGASERIIRAYLSSGYAISGNGITHLTQLPGKHPLKSQILKTLEIESGGRKTDRIAMGDEISFRITYDSPTTVQFPRVGVVIESDTGTSIVAFGTATSGADIKKLEGNGVISCNVSDLPLNAGTYYVKLVLGQINGPILEEYNRAARITIDQFDTLRSGKVPGAKWGFLVWKSTWRLTEAHSGKMIE